MTDLIQEIYSTILRNKLRTFLTGFAVAWGIFMLIVLLGAGNGLIHANEEAAKGMAMNSIRVSPGWTSKPHDGLKEGRRIRLDNQDFELTERMFKENVVAVGATVRQSGITLSHGQDYVSISLLGVYPNHLEVERPVPAGGRFINEIDIRERRKSIVLHTQTADMLFKTTDADKVVGKFVNAGDVAFQVVGLYIDQGNMQPDAFVPFSTLQTIYDKGNQLNNLIFTTQGLDSEEKNQAFEQEYRKVIGAHQRFAADDMGALWIWNRFTQYLQQQTGMNILTTAIWVIGIFTLLSGIVGVSNIMLITVKERTHEFGIRKALGAKPMSILWLIIAESIAITTFFGYIGMLAGIAATEWMNYVAGNQTIDAGGNNTATVFLNPTVDISIAIQATLTLVIAGTLAGFFPARKAVMIKPIEALRAD